MKKSILFIAVFTTLTSTCFCMERGGQNGNGFRGRGNGRGLLAKVISSQVDPKKLKATKQQEEAARLQRQYATRQIIQKPSGDAHNGGQRLKPQLPTICENSATQPTTQKFALQITSNPHVKEQYRNQYLVVRHDDDGYPKVTDNLAKATFFTLVPKGNGFLLEFVITIDGNGLSQHNPKQTKSEEYYYRLICQHPSANNSNYDVKRANGDVLSSYYDDPRAHWIQEQVGETEYVFKNLGTGGYLIIGQDGHAYTGWYGNSPKEKSGATKFRLIKTNQ